MRLPERVGGRGRVKICISIFELWTQSCPHAPAPSYISQLLHPILFCFQCIPLDFCHLESRDLINAAATELEREHFGRC